MVIADGAGTPFPEAPETAEPGRSVTRLHVAKRRGQSEDECVHLARRRAEEKQLPRCAPMA